MADINYSNQQIPRHTFDGVGDVSQPKPQPKSPLDSEESEATFRRLKEWWVEARTIHSWNREQQSIDADFYDGLQWSDEDAATLKERYQAPLVFNIIAKHVNWLVGTERRTKVDWRVFPREDSDRKNAETKTQLLKYISDVNRSEYARSHAFQDAVKVGVGWLEEGVRSDPDEEPLYSRHVPWREVWYDHLDREPNLTNARYVFRAKYVDLDIAQAMFPERAEILRQSSHAHNLMSGDEDTEYSYYQGRSDTDHLRNSYTHHLNSVGGDFTLGLKRNRVRLIECWYRMPVKKKRLRPAQGLLPDEQRQVRKYSNMPSDDMDDSAKALLTDGYLTIQDAIKMQMHCAVFCDKGLLQLMESPYKHNNFPFTPVWCYRRDRDGMAYGVVRQTRDIQDDLNKRRSKALHILSTRRIIADEDAVPDWDELQEEAAKPDSIIRKKPGRELEINTDTSLAAEHVGLMEQDIGLMESLTGITEENLGEETNAQSGRAIIARQTQGGVVTASLFDNLRQSIQMQGEKQLALIEQYYDQAKVIRITNDRGAMEFAQINMPEFDPQTGEIITRNQITENQADFVVDAQDFRESARLAMAEQMLDMIQAMPPEVSLQLLDLVVEMLDVPNKDEVVKRIRSINGQIDPDSEDAEMQEQQKAQSDAEQAAITQEQLATEIAAQKATTEKAQEDAASVRADTLKKAAEIAQLLAATPQLAPIADSIYAQAQADIPVQTPVSASPILSPDQTMKAQGQMHGQQMQQADQQMRANEQTNSNGARVPGKRSTPPNGKRE